MALCAIWEAAHWRAGGSVEWFRLLFRPARDAIPDAAPRAGPRPETAAHPSFLMLKRVWRDFSLPALARHWWMQFYRLSDEVKLGQAAQQILQ
jgi:hypothetical protein